MSDMAKYPGLTKRGNIWYYRVKVPVDLVKAFAGQKEKKKSLQTPNLKEAKNAYFSAAKHFSDLFEKMQGGGDVSEVSELALTKSTALLLARQYVMEKDSNLPEHQIVGASYSPEEIKDALIDRHIQIHLLEDRTSDEGVHMAWESARDVLNEVEISLSFEREDHHYFAELMRRAMLELARRDLARANQDFSNQVYDVLFSEGPSASGQTKPAGQMITFGELCENYFLDFEVSHTVKPKSLKKKKASLSLLVELLGVNVPVETVDRARCRKVRDTLAKLPSNMKKKNEGFSIKQHLAAALSDNLPTLGYDTQKTYLNTLMAVVKWGAAEGIMPKIEIDDLKPIGVKVPLKDKKLPFSDDQLTLIFSQPIYVGCKDDKLGFAKPGPNVPRRGRFWVPLIGLFSGMRESEICQLKVSDVKNTDAGILYFNVSVDDLDQSVKTESGFRSVPVHDELLKCGFAEYVEEARKSKAKRLFPELPTGSTGYPGDPFSKWFNDGFLRKAGAKTDKTSFHSFRHRYRDALRDALVSDEIADALGGWKTAKSTGGVYGSGYSVKVLSEHMQKIEYPNLDLSHLYEK